MATVNIIPIKISNGTNKIWNCEQGKMVVLSEEFAITGAPQCNIIVNTTCFLCNIPLLIVIK